MSIPEVLSNTKQWHVETCHCLEGLRSIPEKMVQCVVTSPPYWGLRSYFPGAVVLKSDAPRSVLEELESLGIEPMKERQ